MRRVPLALLAALAAVVLLPRTLGVLRGPHYRPPVDLHDAMGGEWSDLATLHEKVGLPGDRCAWCHLELDPRAARAAAQDPARWIASAGAAAAAIRPVTSTMCLSCHDGTVASAAVNFGSGPRPHGAAPDGANHPVGVDYIDAVLRSPGAYNHPSARPEIRLEAGKVGCLSCHVGHSRNARPSGPAGLTVESCNSCHAF